MTPDEVVMQFKISSEMIENNGRKFGLNEYEKDLLKAIESASSLIQDYQKLRESNCELITKGRCNKCKSYLEC